MAPNASADTVSVDFAGSMVGNAATSDQLIVLPVDAADTETAGNATLPTIVTDAATAATFPNFFIPNPLCERFNFNSVIIISCTFSFV